MFYGELSDLTPEREIILNSLFGDINVMDSQMNNVVVAQEILLITWNGNSILRTSPLPENKY